MAWIYEIGTKKYFTDTQKQNNALEFYNFFSPLGLTLESIAGILGNIERESTLNPGLMETSSETSGWGLIQWTPGTIIVEWCQNYGYAWYDGWSQCERIRCEGTGEKGAGGTWIPTSSYPYSWEEFCALTSVSEATKAYLYERERAGVEALEERLENAAKWYTYLSGKPVPPDPPTPTPGTRRKMKFIYYMKRRL